MEKSDIKAWLGKLTGEPPLIDKAPDSLAIFAEKRSEIGFSQLNELLLLFGFDRISKPLFMYLLENTTSNWSPGKAFKNEEDLKTGIERFMRLALLIYGNVKFGFKMLSRNERRLERSIAKVARISARDFVERHEELLKQTPIDAKDSYLTGFEVKSQLQKEAEKNNRKALDKLRRCKKVQVIAQKNLTAYMASDHLDVYVATSMREAHEFFAVRQFVIELFSHSSVSGLNLRCFDPTQANCEDRIDKGLVEALMLRRAKCTVYLAQATDTLGKDSELAATLAQGKPVIAYVPLMEECFDKIIQAAKDAEEGVSEMEVLLKQLQIYAPKAAWDDRLVRTWWDTRREKDLPKLRKKLFDTMKERYDARAKTLKDIHPLGIQVNQTNGVAVGVLVARTIPDCAKLVRGSVLRNLEFKVTKRKNHLVLEETISGCAFRVQTDDRMLANTFWNFYLRGD